MKCGYCGNDFTESQHHCCPEGQRFLLDELTRLRAEVEMLVWNLAGISTLACSRTPTDYNRDMARPALNDVAKLVEDYSRLRAANAKLVEAIQKCLRRMTSNGMGEWKEAKILHAAISRAEQAKPETCVWAGSPSGYWATKCGEGMISKDATPYCPFCGKRIEVAGKAEGIEK